MATHLVSFCVTANLVIRQFLVFFARHADGWVGGEFWEPIYGGIHIEWHTHIQNLKHWKEVDAAIWRLLETWNVSPLVNPNQQ